MAPEVFYTVCYHDPDPPEAIKNMHSFSPAILHDYCRHRVEFADYPGIIPEKGRSVRGIYATGLTDANMDKLDYFEGSEYERKEVKVKLLKQEGGKEVEGEEKSVIVYVFLYPQNLEHSEWDFEQFRKDKLRNWVRGDLMDGQGMSTLPLCAPSQHHRRLT